MVESKISMCRDYISNVNTTLQKVLSSWSNYTENLHLLKTWLEEKRNDYPKEVRHWICFCHGRQRYLEASWKESIICDSCGCCCFSIPRFGSKVMTGFCLKLFQCLSLDPCWDPGKLEFSAWFLKWSWKLSHRSQQRASQIKYCQRAQETEQEVG